MTTTAADYRPIPMSEPTSRLHAAANALARWDHDTGSGEDIGGVPGVLPEHWDGAQAVWDALQPKYDTAAELDALTVGDVIVKHSRDGVVLWRRHADSGWWPMLMPDRKARTWMTSEQVLHEHGSVRLLWTRA